jgi:hypothetical protein
MSDTLKGFLIFLMLVVVVVLLRNVIATGVELEFFSLMSL